jgi:hypothetical protein
MADMAIIVIRNYGKEETKNAGPEFGNSEYRVWHETFEPSSLNKLREEELSKRKEELKSHVERGEARWAFKLDYIHHKERLERIIAMLENENSTCGDVSGSLDEGCCVPVPEGMDVEEFKVILKRVWNTGYCRGYDEGMS